MNRKKLTEKINGRREWSVYGLNELDMGSKMKSDSGPFKAIIISNALSECGLKCFGHSRSFRIGSKMFVYITKEGVVVVKGIQGVIEEIDDPRTLFDRLRIVWGNISQT